MFNEVCRIVGLIVVTNYVVDRATKAINEYVESKKEKDAIEA